MYFIWCIIGRCQRRQNYINAMLGTCICLCATYAHRVSDLWKQSEKKEEQKKQTKINDIFITYDLSLSMSIYMYQLWLALHIHSSNKHRFLLVVVVVVVFRRCLFTTIMRTCNSSITKCISTATPPSRYPEINKNKIYLLFICWMNICVCARCGTLPALWQRQYIDRSVI